MSSGALKWTNQWGIDKRHRLFPQTFCLVGMRHGMHGHGGVSLGL